MSNHLLDELITLDERGFILGPHADPRDHVELARQTLEWAQSVRRDLDESGETEIMGARFTAEQRLSDEVMDECLAAARSTYRINPDWVPAFFSSEYLPWYVGGASFYGTRRELFQVCFVLRKNFRDTPRWLIYNRNEIASHEACHVARAGFAQERYEEPLAYALSGSWLRRNLGGMFTSNWEAASLLLSSVLLLGGSIAGVVGAPGWVRWASGIPLVVTGTALSARATIANRELSRARQFLQGCYGKDTSAVLFRCTDEEIKQLARAETTSATVEDWLTDRTSPRWEVIEARFGAETESCES